MHTCALSLTHAHTHTHTNPIFLFAWVQIQTKSLYPDEYIPQTKQRNDNATPANNNPPILFLSTSVFFFRLFPLDLLVFNPVTRAIAFHYFRGNWYSLSHLSDSFESCFKGQRSKLESLFCEVLVKRDVRFLTFELSKSLRKYHHGCDRLYQQEKRHCFEFDRFV